VRLKDAIIAAASEYETEVFRLRTQPDLDRRAAQIITSEFAEIMESGELERIAAIYSRMEPGQPPIEVDICPLAIAFRLGMRTQRKLTNPELTTSLFDLEKAH